MGKSKIHIFTFLFFIFFQSTVALAAAPFIGCPDWCRATYGSAGERAIDNCLVQTQSEGFCGAAAIKSPIPKPTPRPDTGGSTPTNTPVGSGYTCETTYESLLQQCNNSVTTTANDCNADYNQELNSASQMALQLGQQTSSSITASCSQMANISQAANGAVAAYKMTCGKAISSCKTSCEDVVKYVRENPTCFTGVGSGVTGMSSSAAQSSVDTAAKRCDSYESKVSDANKAIQNYAATAANAAQCEEMTAGGTSTNPTPTFCEQNPGYPGCTGAGKVDCADPTQASSNKVCVCAANPTNSMCYASLGNNEVGSAGGSIDSSSRLAKSDADNGGGDLPDLPSMMHGKRGSGGSGEAVDGSQGGAPVGSADGGSGGGPRKSASAGGGAAEEDGIGGRGGFYGSSGKNGFGSGGSDAAAGNRGRAAGAVNGSSVASNSNPDLRKFLPGGTYDPKNRGLAGASGPDGITGPDSNIWQKIQNRYRVMSPSLLP